MDQRVLTVKSRFKKTRSILVEGRLSNKVCGRFQVASRSGGIQQEEPLEKVVSDGKKRRPSKSRIHAGTERAVQPPTYRLGYLGGYWHSVELSHSPDFKCVA